MIVLKIIGWVLLGLIGLVFAALCVRVKLNIEYSDDNTSVLLKYLFLKIPIYPSEKKAEPKIKQSEPEPIEAGVSKEPKGNSNLPELLKTFYHAEGVDGLKLLMRRTGDYLGTFFSGILRGVVIDDLVLDVCCAKGDAAQTAIYYGEVSSVIFPVLGSIASRCKMKRYDINVYPDFLARFSSASFILNLSFSPIGIIGISLALIIKLLFKIVLQIVCKIFLYSKQSGKTENDNKKMKEKSEVTNE